MFKDIHDANWLRQIIDEAIQHVINENKVKEEHRALTADEQRQYGIECFDFKGHQANEIARALMYAFEKIKQQGDETSDFYCGISNDVVKRKEDHENKDYNGKTINRFSFGIEMCRYENCSGYRIHYAQALWL